MIRLFLSSVGEALADLRRQVVDDLREAAFDTSSMEIFAARPELPLEVCLAEVRKCDAVITIIGPRYGTLTPSGDVSFTHAEFREAVRHGIPVLAFTLAPAEDASDEERERLQAFIAEAGQAVVYKKTDQSNLRAHIATTLLQRLQAGDLGRRFTVFQKYEQFFSQQLQQRALFNHLLPLVGREETLAELVTFLQSDVPALVMTGRGGSGKSRLLLELAKRAPDDDGQPRLRFIGADVQWTAEDVGVLPATPLVLVVDDAHRRLDLGALGEACLVQNQSVRFLLTCRPASVDGVRQQLRTIERADASIPTMRLDPLGVEAVSELARHALTKEYASLAERLVAASDGNPLVIAVGGRCIAAGKTLPELLDRTPEEFKRVVLDRMLDDGSCGAPEKSLRRNVLEVLSAIGPVSLEDPTVPERLAGFLNCQAYEVRNVMGGLERHGLLLRRGRLGRVTPDVLADHLLYCKAIAPDQKPTGFIDAVFDKFGPAFLGNILANAAELDWRTAAMDGSIEVLEATWKRIESTLPGLPHHARADLVGNLHRAAIYTPHRVLVLLKWLLRNPDAPDDPTLSRLGLSPRTEALQDRICELLKLIATHPDLTRACVDLLCSLAPSDARATNTYPFHPRRVLADLAGYDVRRPAECQQIVVKTVIEQVSRASGDSSVAWAIPILGAALTRTGESYVGTRSTLTIEAYSLADRLTELEPIRTEAIGALVSIGNRKHRGDAAAAVRELGQLLSVPPSVLGREVTIAEVRTWLPEARDIVRRLGQIAATARSDEIRYLARRRLRDFRPDFWPDLAREIQAVLQATSAVSKEMLFDLLVGLPYDEHFDDWQAKGKRAVECSEQVVRGLWAEHGEPTRLLRSLVAAVQSMAGACNIDSRNYGKLAQAIAREAQGQLSAWVSAILQHSSEEAHQLLPAALIIARERDEEHVFSQIIEGVLKSPHETARFHAAQSFSFFIEPESARLTDLRLLKRFLGDPSATVRRAAIWPLGQFRQQHTAQAAEALVSVEFGEDPSLADEVCRLFCRPRWINPDLLTDVQIDEFLRKLEVLAKLESCDHNILEFMAYASKRRPTQVVKMLLNRIRASRPIRQCGAEVYRALPLGGRTLSLPGLRETSEFLPLLRTIRNAALTAKPLELHHLATLFAVAADIRTAATILREWSTSRESERVITAASLVRRCDHNIVFALSDFIADTLDGAAQLGEECCERVKGEFFGVAVSGIWMGAPGQPSPRHVNIKQRATELAGKYAARPVVRSFYESLAQHADDSIRREMAEFEEEEFE